MIKKQLINSLSMSRDILENLIMSIPGDKLHLKRGEDFWSVYQHAVHLAECQEMLAGRIRLFIENPRPKIIPFDPEKETEKTNTDDVAVSEILNRFSLWRENQLEMITAADGDIWKRESDHPQYENYTFEILIRHILLHDYFHMYRIEELWLVRDEFLTNL